MKAIAILGATGSIGQSALAVVEAHPSRLRVVALAGGSNASRLAEQAARHRPSRVALATEDAGREFTRSLGDAYAPEVSTGDGGLVHVATHPDADIVLFASAGTAALDAVLAAIEAGKTIALANKEILVMAGAVVMAAARARGVAVLPVDSEHNAIHQCLQGHHAQDVKRLVLTASGGPFRRCSHEQLSRVTAEDALQHPTWRMGPKITIDSATLMNKGLEVIEARWLFETDASRIDVLVHPQSIVHSMVEFVDGSCIAQLGVTDMRLPIQYAFSYPERWEAPLPPLDLVRAGRLEFEAPDLERFPCLALAFEALKGEEGLPIVLNAANEIAVAAFLQHSIAFTAIPGVIAGAMEAYAREARAPIVDLADVRRIDAWARDVAARSTGGLQSSCRLPKVTP